MAACERKPWCIRESNIPSAPQTFLPFLPLHTPAPTHPVGIDDDNTVCPDKVNSDAADARRQKESKWAPVCVEGVDQGLPLPHGRRAVHPKIAVPLRRDDCLDDTEKLAPLAKDQATVAACMPVAEDLH